MNTYIIGHIKPDTDAVVSSIAMAYFCDQLECLNCQGAIPLIEGPLNPETSFLFDKYKIQSPQLLSDTTINSDDRFILVDHNEESQRPAGINPDQIIDIIDHHKVSLSLNNPIFLNFKPWGSTSTIINFLMTQNKIAPDQQLATLMLSAIISDTVGFKSSTTTQIDIDASKELQKIAQIDDLDAFTLEILKAKSNISQLSDQEIVTNDYKVFDFDKKVFIDQLETVEQQTLLENKKSDLLLAMKQVKSTKKVDLFFVAISDILQVNTKLLILGEEEGSVAQLAFGGQVEDNILDIGPKLSRKKDIAPALEKAVNQLQGSSAS